MIGKWWNYDGAIDDSVKIKNTIISNNITGLIILGENSEILNTTLENNELAIRIESGANVITEISNCIIKNNDNS